MASISSQNTPDGPVLNLINKRIRALRKKLNRISQMEESKSSGKTLNKEQEETLRSKPAVLAGIDELEKLRQPLAEAVTQEIQLYFGENEEKIDAEGENEEKIDGKGENDDEDGVSDLLQLIYFGTVFDVKSLIRARENLLTRTHERNCCLTYDYVTDDDSAGEPLREEDLDLISMLGGLLISRSMDSSLSHKHALQKCVERAKLWLANSEQPIEPDSSITYAGLRERLNKIMASDYFITTPEMKAPIEVAAAAGNYASFQKPDYGSVIPHFSVNLPGENSAADYEPEEEESPDSHDSGSYSDGSGHVEEPHQGESEVENISEVQTQTNLEVTDTEVDQSSGDMNSKEQEHTTQSAYQTYRGGRGGGGRRGYVNGRGGRGSSRGGYQNGRSQFHDQSGGHYQRNNQYKGRGGGRGTGGNYNYTDVTGHDGRYQAAT